MKTVIYNATIVNDDREFTGYVEITGNIITHVGSGSFTPDSPSNPNTTYIDAGGRWLIPGVIDDHVHFRDPGLTHKADIYTESRAAVAGGVTSVMDMPNCKPTTTTLEALNDKYSRAAEVSATNYSFYIGATNDNFDQLEHADYSKVCGIKLFLGSSTGGMLVNNRELIDRLLRFSRDNEVVIATHAEDENIIRANIERYSDLRGDDLPIEYHPLIRSEEACYAATAQIVEMADRIGAFLHVLHISTARELELFSNAMPLTDKRITAEACIAHLRFSDNDYATLGNRIKCNPAIKTPADRRALREAVLDGRIDVVATDHAPHLLTEKEGNCITAASGMPMIQFSLITMLNMGFSFTTTVSRMCHAPATLYRLDKRGYLRTGYFADLAMVEKLHEPAPITDADVVSRCGWTPLAGTTTNYRVCATWVNGTPVHSTLQNVTINPALNNNAQPITRLNKQL